MTLPRERILAIDDIPENLLTLGAVLDDEFELHFATSGPYGIAHALENPPDLILLDVMMPGMDGYETCRQIKASPLLCSIPVVFVTALTGVDAESAGLALGAADYINKPFNVAIVRQRIRNLLEREKLRRIVEMERDRLAIEMVERRRTEAELATSESFKNAILNSMDAEIAVLDHEGFILAVNDPWLRFSLENGRTAGVPDVAVNVGANYLHACEAVEGPESSDANLASKAIRSVLSGVLPTFSLEYPCHSPTQMRWFRMVVLPLGHTVNTGVVVTHTNITDRVEAEQKKALALSQLQKIASRVPGVVYQYRMHPDGSSCFPFASDAIWEIYRVRPDDVRHDASKVFSILHPDDVDGVKASIEKSAQDLTPWNHEYRVKFDDGSVRWLLGNAAPEMESDGSVLWHGFITDVTIRRQVEEELMAHRAELELGESRKRLRELIVQNEKAREEERKYVAQELHDELGQVLTAMRMAVLLVEMQFCALDPALAKIIFDLKALLDQAIQGMRDVVLRLRPGALDMGLVPAIEWLCQEFSRRTGLPCGLHVVDNSTALDETRSIVVFRIVQESLTNISRYADATRVDITICRLGTDWALEVCDNGKGFDPSQTRGQKTFGLLGMRERAKALGGRIDIESAPLAGTTVRVTIPIELENAKESP